VVHHEKDHVDGVLFIDRVESIEDFRRVRMDENGQLMRVAVQAVIIT
jgi:peptide deformylase